MEPRLFGPYVKDPNEEEVDSVTRQVVRCLDSPRPEVRYFITPLIWKLALMVRLLPSRVVDRLLLKAMVKAKSVSSRAEAHAALHPPEAAPPAEAKKDA